MEYIPDISLYCAVMFFLKMCPSLEQAYDRKVNIAAKYYHVSPDDVFTIVQKELWKRKMDEIKGTDRWCTIYHHGASRLLKNSASYVFICPRCGRRFSCCIDDDVEISKLYLQRCSCGFVDKEQREFVRKDFYEYLKQKGAVD